MFNRPMGICMSENGKIYINGTTSSWKSDINGKHKKLSLLIAEKKLEEILENILNQI